MSPKMRAGFVVFAVASAAVRVDGATHILAILMDDYG
jgi:hypothetical protein